MLLLKTANTPSNTCWASMRTLKRFLSLTLVFALVGCASHDRSNLSTGSTRNEGEPGTLRPDGSDAVRVEIWTGCLCGGPDHGNTYADLQKQRAKRMLYGEDFTIAAPDRDLDPIAFLARHLPDQKKTLADHVFKGVAYHPSSDGQSYSKYRNGLLWKLKMGELKGGDLLVCYPEVY
jgi:hypothetical protein